MGEGSGIQISEEIWQLTVAEAMAGVHAALWAAVATAVVGASIQAGFNIGRGPGSSEAGAVKKLPGKVMVAEVPKAGYQKPFDPAKMPVHPKPPPPGGGGALKRVRLRAL